MKRDLLDRTLDRMDEQSDQICGLTRVITDYEEAMRKAIVAVTEGGSDVEAVSILWEVLAKHRKVLPRVQRGSYRG